MAGITQLMAPAAVAARVSRLKVINTTFQTFTGMGFGGANVRLSPTGPHGVYDVFNETREVPGARTREASAATIAPQSVGQVPFVLPRAADKMPLLIATLAQLRRVGGPLDKLDDNAEEYIALQEKIIKQRFTNLREFQIAAMFRGVYSYSISGNDLTHAFGSAGTFTFDYRMPSGNKNQLNMLAAGDIIGTSWANPAAPVIGDLYQINQALIQLSGRGLRHCYCSSEVWRNILNNTEVQSFAGAVNPPFSKLTRDNETEDLTATIAGAPQFIFHVCDNGVSLSGTFTRLIGANDCAFTVEFGPEIAAYYECEEPVVEYIGRPAVMRRGAHQWAISREDPARYDLHGLHNGAPLVFIPAAMAYGTVVF